MDQQDSTVSSEQQGLLPDEQRRLTAGIFAPEEGAPQLLVPLELVRVPSASVAWLNVRWFTERGFNVADASVRRRLEEWVIENFAYVTPPAKAANATRLFHADRYGSTDGLSQHGGSGRVATWTNFQVKGIGRTPLVGRDAADGHAHGCLSLAEALREVVYSEIAAAEFPFGAVPVIAVLDIGLRFSSPDKAEKYDQNVRRGLLVRPFTLRPAHIERAPCFRGVGDVRAEQLADAERVAHMVAWWEAQLSKGDNSLVTEPRELFHRIGRQIGFGHAHRLFNGGYFSSNLSTTGALLDFGNMHWLRRWHRAKVLPHAPGFGDEIQIVRKMAHSLAFFFNRHMRTHSRIEAETLIEAAENGVRAERAGQFSLFVGTAANNGMNVPVDRVMQVFSTDAKTSQKFEFGVPIGGGTSGERLSDAMLMACRNGRGTFGSETDSGNDQQLKATLDRYAGNRDLIDRASLIAATRRLTSDAPAEKRSAAPIQQSLTHLISCSRRFWPRMPKNLVVLSQVVRDESSALLCLEPASRRMVVWVEGVLVPEGACLFGQVVRMDDVVTAHASFDGSYWNAMDETSEMAAQDKPRQIQLGRTQVKLPEWHITYPAS